MKIYIDENFPAQLAKGLDMLEFPNKEGIEVLPIINDFGKGAKDQDWIPPVGQEGGVVITQDINIQRTKSLNQLYQENGLGIFFISAPSKKGFTYWEMVEQIVKRWSELKNIAKRDKRPFAYRCTSRSSKFEKLP